MDPSQKCPRPPSLGKMRQKTTRVLYFEDALYGRFLNNALYILLQTGCKTFKQE